MAGAGAGIVAMSATYPLDMVRGRLTVQEGRNVQYNGILHAARTILKEVRKLEAVSTVVCLQWLAQHDLESCWVYGTWGAWLL